MTIGLTGKEYVDRTRYETKNVGSNKNYTVERKRYQDELVKDTRAIGIGDRKRQCRNIIKKKKNTRTYNNLKTTRKWK